MASTASPERKCGYATFASLYPGKAALRPVSLVPGSKRKPPPKPVYGRKTPLPDPFRTKEALLGASPLKPVQRLVTPSTPLA